jgi:hypothetical protein
MNWTERRIRKKLGKLAVNMRVGAVNERQKIGNYKDNEGKADDRNGELEHDW